MSVALELRLVVMGFSIAVVLVWLAAFRRLPMGFRAAASLPVGWAIHCIIFGAATTMGCCPMPLLNIWSNIIRAHGLVAWIIGGLYLIAELRRA